MLYGRRSHCSTRRCALFEENRLGKACFNLHELEAILRHSHATGRREMAQECADALQLVAADSEEVRLSKMADQFDRWAKKAEAEERHWL